ncbi:sodium/hydrogen exchanger 3-like, partial [Thrips palmi]|uniref:Sodium/hydrogen exchanger n=1 Tax=Thrips palmi TaxID=161013 RepID=A0A6P8ZY32_THRPL
LLLLLALLPCGLARPEALQLQPEVMHPQVVVNTQHGGNRGAAAAGPDLDSGPNPGGAPVPAKPGDPAAATTEAPATGTTTRPPIRRYTIASVEFERVETPFLIGLWIFCASLAKIGFHMAPSLSKMFPESCLLIAVGVAIGILLFLTDKLHVSPLTPDTFFLYMLPPIILDAGYFMPNRLFFDHLGTILWYAVVGTIFNTLTIGASLWAVGQTGLFGCDTPLLDMFLFSALISAVDPVAVLAVFEEIHVNEILYIVVFGESLLNDAVTVVLYHMFESYTEMGPSNILATDLLAGFASFFVVALGGTVIGIIWGFATGLVTRFTHQVRVIEPIFIFVMAYLCYLNAEIFHLSGIMAITFCGITMKNYVEANISHKSHTTVKYAMKMLSSSSETVIFMFLGVATVNKNHDWNTWFVILTIFFCSVFRSIGVIVLTALVNPFRLYKLDRVEKFVMSYGGLRGAVAFALVLLINPTHVKLQPMFVTTTIAVIYFTVFFQGITIKPLVKILNVKRAEKRKPTMNERIHERFMDHTMAGIEDILGHHGNHHVRDKFKRFDNKFIRPYLLRDYKGAEPKILETFSKLTMKDAMELMKRNASNVGNISGTESMSAIFRNYTSNNLNLNGSASFNQADSSTWNIDMQELEYNPSKKDLTDAKIHHLLAEELCKPYRRRGFRDELHTSGREHRRLSYSRHAVNDRDLSTQEVNYRMHMNHIRRLVGDERKHHHKRSKRLGKVSSKRLVLKDGKQNHVSFPGIQQNGSAKQFSHDYIDEVIMENEDGEGGAAGKEEWEGGITFTVHPSPSVSGCGIPLWASGSVGSPGGSAAGSGSTSTECALLTHVASLPGLEPRRARLVRQYSKPLLHDYDDAPVVAEVSLPWRREREEEPHSGSGPIKKISQSSQLSRDDVSENGRVSTPTATESVLPWKRDDDSGELSGPVKQREFPPWCTNKEYLAYNSPSATFLGGIEQPKTASVIGLFRRDGSVGSRTPSETSLQRQASQASQGSQGSESPPSGPMSILLIEEGVSGDPLGVSTSVGRRPLAGRRGSLLELSALSSSVDPIPEEDAHSGSTQATTPSTPGPTPSPATTVAAGSPAETTPAAQRRRPGSSLSQSGPAASTSSGRLRQQTLSSGSSASSFGEDLPMHVQLAEMEEDLDTEDDLETASEETRLSTARK